MADNVQTSRGGPSTLGLLGVAFIVLKLTGVIDWSWLWVLAPFWIPVAIIVGVLLLVLLAKILVDLLDRRARKKRQKRLAERKGYRKFP